MWDCCSSVFFGGSRALVSFHLGLRGFGRDGGEEVIAGGLGFFVYLAPARRSCEIDSVLLARACALFR